MCANELRAGNPLCFVLFCFGGGLKGLCINPVITSPRTPPRYPHRHIPQARRSTPLPLPCLLLGACALSRHTPETLDPPQVLYRTVCVNTVCVNVLCAGNPLAPPTSAHTRTPTPTPTHTRIHPHEHTHAHTLTPLCAGI